MYLYKFAPLPKILVLPRGYRRYFMILEILDRFVYHPFSTTIFFFHIKLHHNSLKEKFLHHKSPGRLDI
jgi:hypothetical protein